MNPLLQAMLVMASGFVGFGLVGFIAFLLTKKKSAKRHHVSHAH